MNNNHKNKFSSILPTLKALIVVALILTLVSLQQACDISNLFGFKFSGSSIVSSGGGGGGGGNGGGGNGGGGGGGGNNPGTLDYSFGNNGAAIFSDNNNENNSANAMAIHNNKIYLAGWIGPDVLLLRYNDDGTLDNSFGNNGFATFDNDGNVDEAHAMAIHNNKIYLAGWTGRDVLLLRYNDDGTLDTSFGNNGFVTFEYNNNRYDDAHAIAFDNNYIYLAGSTYELFRKMDLLLLRCDLNGTLDTSFGNNGFVTFEYNNNRYDDAHAIAFDNNYIYLAGSTYDRSSNNYDVLLLRYDLNGTLDTSFGNNGVATYNNTSEGAYAMAIDNNFVYLAGFISQNNRPTTLLLRFFK